MLCNLLLKIMSNNLPPLVSIVLATYNGGTFLQEQLDSLLEQTYTNIEIIAVDDGSTDNTLDILNAYAAKHAHIKVHAGNNVGYIKNFERGCRLAGGAYISLCDQDDKWEKEKIALMMEAIGEHPLVFCDSIVCDERLNDTGKRISTFANFQSRYHCAEISVFCRIYGNATLFTKALFTAADPFLEVIPHDWWISYVATLHGGIKYLDQQLVYYRQHSANVIGAVGGSKPKKDKQAKKEKKKANILKNKNKNSKNKKTT